MNLLQVVHEDFGYNKLPSFPDFKSGDTVSVHVQVTEAGKTRTQIFQGICVAIKNKGKIDGHFRVRKVSAGMGVERVFPYFSPVVKMVELVSSGKTRKSKHYFLRGRKGKSARISIDYEKEKKQTLEVNA